MGQIRELATEYKRKTNTTSKSRNGNTEETIALAIDRVREGFKGEAERLGLRNEEDVVEMIKQIRKERGNKVVCE